MILVDANVILDVWDPDPVWHTWSSTQLRNQSLLHELAIGLIVYSEISISFATVFQVDEKLEELGIVVLNLSRQAVFLAGKTYAQYKRRGGIKSNVLADFLIGAQAAVLGCALLTRDTRIYRLYFPSVQLIAP
jgi:predicted nucleic acid-binding protein